MDLTDRQIAPGNLEWVPVVPFAGAGGPDDDDGQRVTAGRAMLAVRAALDATLESGGYEIRFETESTGTAVGTQTVEGHGTLNVVPYALTTVADVSHLGSITVRTDGVNLWEHGGGQYGLSPDGTEGPGQSLAGFADLVESTIGKGPGAVSMLNLASPTGSVFGDGARFRTHTALSHFGCVGRVLMPGEATAPPPPAVSDGCTAPPTDVSSTTASSTTTTLPTATTTVVGGTTSSTTTSVTTTPSGAATSPLTRISG